jgi:hypothetical protein
MAFYFNRFREKINRIKKNQKNNHFHSIAVPMLCTHTPHQVIRRETTLARVAGI